MSGTLLDTFTSLSWAMRAEELAIAASLVWRHDRGLRYSDDHVAAATSRRMLLDEQTERREDYGFVTRGSVAVIPIGGVIAKYANQVNGSSQPRGTSIDTIRRAFREAMRADGIGSILLVFDSPGGAASGVDALAAEIREAVAAGVVVESFIDDCGCSAAYYLASQASRITGNSATTAVGSIAVYTVLLDSSKAAEEEGVTVHLIASGRFKGTGVDGVPISKDRLAKVQEEIDALHEAFVSAVAMGRNNLSIEQVRALATGEVWIGEAAVQAGLLDEIQTLDAVLERMDRDNREQGRVDSGGTLAVGGPAMADKDPKGPARAGDKPTQPKAGEPTATPKAGEPTPAPKADDGGEVLTLTPDRLEKMIADGVAKATAANAGRAKAAANEIRAATEPFAGIAKVAELARDALSDPLGADIPKLRQDVLDAVAADSPPSRTILQVGESGADRKRHAIETVLVTRTMPNVLGRINAGGDKADRMARVLGFDDASAFRKADREAVSAGIHRRCSLLSLAEQCAMAATGQRAFATDNEVLAAAMGHSSSDFPDILSNLANKTLLAEMEETPSKWEMIAAAVNLNDFKETPMLSMSEAPDLLLTDEGDTPERGDLNERKETIKAATYTREFVLTRQMVVNDDLGAFTRIPRLFGRAAVRVPEVLTWAIVTNNPFMSDGVRLFDAAHNNLGSAAALSMKTVQDGIEAMESQRGFGDDQAYLEIEAGVLAVPSNLRFKALKLRESEFDPDTISGRDPRTEPNVIRGTFEVASTPRLKADSATAYYLFADPRRTPAIGVGFLNGNRTPTIVQVGNGSILSRSWEIVFDCAAAALQHEAAYKNAGA